MAGTLAKGCPARRAKAAPLAIAIRCTLFPAGLKGKKTRGLKKGETFFRQNRGLFN
jgi:hypothetical protein